MALKDLFSKRKSGSAGSQEPKESVQDLMELERWDEAEKVLNERLKKRSNDTATIRKLAELYSKTGRPEEAIAEYRRASDHMARDGFHDRAIATLARAAKVSPGNAAIATRIEQLRSLKAAENKGREAVDGLRGQEREKATRWIQMRQHWRRIKSADFVRMLDEAQIPLLFDALERQAVPADGPIIRQGDKNESLYIITSGEVRVLYRHATATKPSVLRTYAAGDILGDQALFERKPWRASYEAVSEAVLLRLTREGLEKALQGNSDPRQLINALRSQRRDGQVLELIQKLE